MEVAEDFDEDFLEDVVEFCCALDGVGDPRFNFEEVGEDEGVEHRG